MQKLRRRHKGPQSDRHIIQKLLRRRGGLKCQQGIRKITHKYKNALSKQSKVKVSLTENMTKNKTGNFGDFGHWAEQNGHLLDRYKNSKVV